MPTPSHAATHRRNAYLLYWAAILGACTMGETAGDYFSFGLAWGYGWTSIILGGVLAISLWLDTRVSSKSEVRYWSKIVIMSTAGTAFADYITRTMKLGYGYGSLFLAGLFALIYIVRKLNHGRRRRRGEAVLLYTKRDTATGTVPDTDIFYWATILVTSTFGTTMGDFVSDALGLGFAGGAAFLTVLFVIFVLLDYRNTAVSIAFYWLALVTASTIGATTGDFLTKPDGLDLGYTIGSVIVISVAAAIFIGRKATLRRLAPILR